MSSNISVVRQTLTLMVSNGRILRTVHLPYQHWGITIAGYGAAVWRTGIGVTGSGGDRVRGRGGPDAGHSG